MRDPENIRAVEKAGPDMMGFICWDGTKRNVTTIPAYLPDCIRVGVFVNPSITFVCDMADKLNLQMIQLHGNESSFFCEEVRKATGLSIAKAISIENASDLKKAEAYHEAVDLFVFDTKCKCVGGSGEQFDWDILTNYEGPTPFLLSGGIGPDDADRVSNWHHPNCIGIDINSRFEISPAYKDVEKVRQFIYKVKGNNKIDSTAYEQNK